MSTSSSKNQQMYVIALLAIVALIIGLMIHTGILSMSCMGGKEKFEPLRPNSTPNSTVSSNDHIKVMNILDRPNPAPVKYGSEAADDLLRKTNDLLPVTGADESAFEFAPQELKDINFLDTVDRIGLDTISNTLKNANYSIRPDPMIPKTQVSPWMNSEIDADPLRNNKALM